MKHEGTHVLPASPDRPYWKRAHRDWRFWIGMFFMFAAILIYSMREYLL